MDNARMIRQGAVKAALNSKYGIFGTMHAKEPSEIKPLRDYVFSRITTSTLTVMFTDGRHTMIGPVEDVLKALSEYKDHYVLRSGYVFNNYLLVLQV